MRLYIQDELLEEACRLSGQGKEETVIAALQEYIQRHKQVEILDLFGQIEYDPKYDYKEQRQGQE